MPPSSTASFIPKRNPSAQKRAPRHRNFFILPLVSYSLFIAAPLASAGVFIYHLQVQKNFAEVVKNLDTAIATFNQSDYDRVITFSKRLSASRELVDEHVSVTSLLRTMSAATANTVQFKTLELTHKEPQKIVVKADLRTSALDGALFQRGQYTADTLINTTAFSDVKLTQPTAEEIAGGVELKAEFSFNPDAVKYQPMGTSVPVLPGLESATENISTSSDVTNKSHI